MQLFPENEMKYFSKNAFQAGSVDFIPALLNLSGGNGMIVTYSKVAEQRNEECLVGSLELVG